MTDTPMNQAMNPVESSKANTSGMLRLFVYGTLKRGFWNHDRFCRGVLAVEDAVVRGRLFETSSGIPVLQVPEEDVLAHGTTDPLADVATQARFAALVRDPESTPNRLPKNATCAPWGPVYGELLIFDDPETRLQAIDRLEGFHPGGPCLYCRVLVPVRVNGAMLPAWLYVGENRWISSFKELLGGVWH
ncbi:MAG: gamma-glutamylcyclotransferase [Deltaproteobacteria bacterium]|nr:gamma-glutamylcyclotransferase [Deltaproteobacteria bacterium]